VKKHYLRNIRKDGNKFPEISELTTLVTTTEQFSHALKTHLFTLDWSCGSPRRLGLFISTDELWRRLQIQWL